MHSDFGELVWVRTDPGEYYAVLPGVAEADIGKAFVSPCVTSAKVRESPYVMSVQCSFDLDGFGGIIILVETFVDGVRSDGVLGDTFFGLFYLEVRVYP
jgi:hypothetical protein